MTVKEYLKQVRVLDKRIETLKEADERIVTQLTHITADPSKEFIAGSKSYGMNDGLIEQLSNVRRELLDAIMQNATTRARITLEIQTLDKAEYIDVLRLRYIDCKEWKEIAMRMNYSESNLYWLHGMALRAFADKFSSKSEFKM